MLCSKDSWLIILVGVFLFPMKQIQSRLTTDVITHGQGPRRSSRNSLVVSQGLFLNDLLQSFLYGTHNNIY